MDRIRWGLIGTGFAAARRAEAIIQDPRAQLVAVAGRDWHKTQQFCQALLVSSVPMAAAAPIVTVAVEHWRSLLIRDDIDAIAVCTISSDHAQQTDAILRHDKHAIVEYPLALDPQVAQDLLHLARSRDRLLHVEHIELLGGLHRTAIEHLPSLGAPYYGRYVTLQPKHPAPRRWSYCHAEFGFPLVGALSRVMRLVDLFGAVVRVSASVRDWPALQEHDQAEAVPEGGYYSSCLAQGVLEFQNGVMAELIYGKGDRIWNAQNQLEIWGEAGSLRLEPDRGWLLHDQTRHDIPVGGRRGLFARDTAEVIAALLDGTPLYVQPEQSLYALEVAEGLRRSAQGGEWLMIEAKPPSTLTA